MNLTSKPSIMIIDNIIESKPRTKNSINIKSEITKFNSKKEKKNKTEAKSNLLVNLKDSLMVCNSTFPNNLKDPKPKNKSKEGKSIYNKHVNTQSIVSGQSFSPHIGKINPYKVKDIEQEQTINTNIKIETNDNQQNEDNDNNSPSKNYKITERKTFKEVNDDIEYVSSGVAKDPLKIKKILSPLKPNDVYLNKIDGKQLSPNKSLFDILTNKKDFMFLINPHQDNFQLPCIINDDQRAKIQSKKEILQREGITYHMERYKREDIPLVFPIALIHDKEFKNNSEKRRCEKYTQKFLNLKTLIEKDEFNDKNLVKEVSEL